jgi:hypothetical protein
MYTTYIKVQCDCGCVIGRSYFRKHQLTQKHKKLMSQKSSVVNTPEKVMEEMDRLEDRKEDMSSGDYMIECNRLKDLFYKLKNEIEIQQFIRMYT